jgi:hypothetical protein
MKEQSDSRLHKDTHVLENVWEILKDGSDLVRREIGQISGGESGVVVVVLSVGRSIYSRSSRHFE